MKNRFLKKVSLIALALVAFFAIAHAATTRVLRYTFAGVQIFDLRSDGTIVLKGPLASGSDISTPTTPTSTTGSQYAHWVPVYNVGSAVTAGDVLIASNTGTGYVTKGTATTNLTSVVGVAAQAIGATSKGWMIPRGGGYAVVHTTGTVNTGDVLVTTTSAAGYGTGTATPTAGAGFAIAMASGTTAGGSILAILR